MKKFTFSALACFLMCVFSAQAQFSESFDVVGTPAGWTVINVENETTAWEFGPLPEIADPSNDAVQPHSGAGVAYITWSQGHDDYLITPQFTVTAGTSDQLRFYSRNWGATLASNNSDVFNVELSTTGNNAEDFTIVLESEIIPPTEWTEYIFDLSEYEGQQVRIAIHAVTEGSKMRLYLDDLHIENIPNCSKPSQLNASVVSFTEVDLSWTENGSADSWEIVYGETGFDPTTGGTTLPASGTPTYSLTGLSPDTHYDFYIRALCGSENQSDLSAKASFYSGYCPFISGTTDRYIESFSTQSATENISNLNTGLSPNGYGDYTDMAVKTFAGGDFDFNAIMNFVDVGMTYTISIWIDFNNDLVFDESEQVFIVHYVQQASGTIEIPAGTPNGNYRMRVVGGNNYFSDPYEQGDIYAEAEDYTVTVMGAPTCLPPSGVTIAEIYAESVKTTWTPIGGVTNWEVLYGETGFDVATEGTTTMASGLSNVTLTDLNENTKYDFYITAICSEGDLSSPAGPGSFTTLCLPTTLPYSIDFENVEIPSGIPTCTAHENAGNGNNWETIERYQNGFSGTVLRYHYSQSYSANAWFYTQGIELESGTNYVITYKYGNSDMFNPERMKVAVGTSTEHTAMVNQLANHPVITGGQAETHIVNFMVPTTGVYYFGFNAYSVQNQLNLYLDDISIFEGSVCTDATDIGVSDIEGTTATVSWTGSIIATQGYEVSVYLGGDDPATATPVFTETYVDGFNEAPVTGLSPNTTYDVYITAHCGAGVSSTSNVVSFTTDDAVGVSNYDVTNITYFPNPVKDQLTVTASTAIESVTVYNLLGAAVMQIGSNETDVVIDMSSLPAGSYLLKASVAEGVSTFKVIKE